MTVPSLDIDEFWGVGGEYLLSPENGKRSLVARTEPAPNPQLEPTDAIAHQEADNPPQG